MIKMLLPFILVTMATASELITTLEKKIETGCASCHLVGVLSPERVANMKAPPMWGVMKKVKAAYPEQEEAVKFMVDYMKNPSESKMLFPKKTIERFGGMMPSQKSLFSDEELREMSVYLIEKY